MIKLCVFCACRALPDSRGELQPVLLGVQHTNVHKLIQTAQVKQVWRLGDCMLGRRIALVCCQGLKLKG